MEQRNLEEKFDYLVFYDKLYNRFIVVCHQKVIHFVWTNENSRRFSIHKRLSTKILKIILSNFNAMRGVVIFRKISYEEAVEKLKKAHYQYSISYWYGVNMR